MSSERAYTPGQSRATHRIPTDRGKDHGKGRCSWCAGRIVREDGTPNLRRTWHRGEPWEERNCLAEYSVTVHPHTARAELEKRDHGICAVCGVKADPFEVDHIVPLRDGGLFTMFNLQTLCRSCHKRKTARENSARRKRKTA